MELFALQAQPEKYDMHWHGAFALNIFNRQQPFYLQMHKLEYEILYYINWFCSLSTPIASFVDSVFIYILRVLLLGIT